MHWYIKSGSLVKVLKVIPDSFVEQDGTLHGGDIFSKWSVAELNNIGLYEVTIVSPTLTSTQKYNGFTDDYVNMTRTFNVVEKTAEQIATDAANAQLKADREAYRTAKDGLDRVDRKAMRCIIALVDSLVAKGTIAMIDLPQPVQDIITDRKARRGSLPTDPDAE